MTDVMTDTSAPTMSRAKAERLVAEACEMDAEMRLLERRISALARKRRSRWLRANRLGGITYEYISTTCRRSPAVVVREIRQARAETTDPALAARLPTRRPGI